MKVKEVLTVLPVVLLLGLGVVGTLAPEQAYAASSSVPDYNPVEGKRFWVTFLSNNNGATEEEAKKVIQLVAVSRNGATVTVHYSEGGTPQDPTTVIAAGEQQTITIDKSRAYNLSAGTNMHSVLVTSTDTISLYAAVRDGSYYESSFILPEGALGYEYVVQNNRRNQSDLRSEYAVVAVESGTTKVHIKQRESNETSTPTTPDVKSETTVSLMQGQVYFVKSTSQYMELDEYGDPVLDYDDNPVYYFGNLSGTSIDADKKIAVFQADEGTMTPYLSGLTQNYIFEQALPISSWGKEFVVVRSERAQYEVVRITTVYKDTKISLKSAVDGTTHTETISNPFSTLEYPFIATNSDLVNKGDLYITADYPIMVSTYIPCKYINNNWGAPAVAAVPPMRQGMKDVTIGLTNYAMSRYFANVIVPTNAVSSMKLDGSSIASSFTAFEGIPYSYARLNLGTSSTPKHLSNSEAPFVVYAYGHGKENAFYYATGFNNVPAAPELYVDNYRVSHGDEAQFCNQHPGVKFKAVVDYPHDSIRWDLGEGAITTVLPSSEPYNTSHMYGKTISQGDTTHNIRLYVFHHSPLAGVKDTDSICVSLVVHPVYYDTLKTKVAAKHLEYIWNKSSNPAFGIEGKGEITLDPAVTMGKDATNPNNKWTTANDSKQIFDSLVYTTKEYGCDSIFYLELDVVPDILMPEETASVCQGEAFTWDGHHNAWNHLTQDGVAITTINTATAGTFVIRDTMQSLVFPYPDSIHILNLTVHPKPYVRIKTEHRKDSVCEGSSYGWTWTYEAAHYDSLYWKLCSPDGSYEYDRRSKRTSVSEGEVLIQHVDALKDGNYIMVIQAFSDVEWKCESLPDTVPLVIKNRPSLKVEGVDPQCWAATAPTFTFNYTPVDAAKITYWVDTVGGTKNKVPSTTIPVDASKKIDIATTGWSAGRYEFYAKPISALGCDSTEVKVEFVINKKPTAEITNVESKCADDEKLAVTFTSKDANTYEYRVFKSGVLVDAATKTAQSIAKTTTTFEILISDLKGAGNYEVRLVAKSTTCESDTAKQAFEIYEMPTAAITSTSAEKSKCITSVTGNETFTYTYSSVTTQIKWQLDRPGTRSTIGWNTLEAGKALTITPEKLDTAGNYVLTITAHSANCDSAELAKGTLEFYLYDTAHINLDDIQGFCKGEDLNATYTTTDHLTTKYTYRIDTVGGATKIGPTEVDEINNKIPSTGTSGLAAGTYVLRVWAANDHCDAASEVSKTFVVNPIPAITNLNPVANLCEKEEESRTITVVGTDVKDVKYELMCNGNKVAGPTTVTLSGGSFTLTTGSLEAGNYTMTLTPISDKGCEGKPFTSANPLFTIYPKPVIDLTKDYTFCEGSQETLDVEYTSSNVNKFEWTLKGGSTVINGSVKDITGTFTIPGVDKLTAGNYIVYASAIYDHGNDIICHSKNDTIKVTVNKTPTATITNVEKEKCASDENVAVTFTSLDAKTYEYRVFKSGVLVDEATKTGQSIATTFNILISDLKGAGNYEVRLVAKSDDCASDTTKGTFTIYPLPEITLLQDTSACEGAGVAQVRYAANEAAVGGTYTYTIQGSSISGTGTLSAKGLIEVSTAGLAGDKDYTVSVTVVSTNNCNSADAKTATLHLYPQPSIEIAPIDNICEKTPTVSVTITSLVGATKYKYAVLKDGKPFKSENTPPTDDMTFELSTLDWEAATYTLQVTAVSDEGCGSTAAETEFKVNPQPKVDKLTPTTSEICEKSTDPVTCNVEMTGAATYTYKIEGTEISGGGSVTAGKGTFTLDLSSLTASAPSTDYTLSVIAKSADKCESEPATVTLTVKNMPSLTIDTIIADQNPNQCSPVEKFVVSYTPVDAARILWKVDGKDAEYRLHNVPNPGFGEYEFEIPTSTWDPGKYTLRAYPESSIMCDSAEVIKSFTINPTPTIKENTFSIENLCAQATATVKFQHTGGKTVRYWIDGNAKTADISGSASDASFLADINGLVGEHTIRMQVISDKGCESAVTADQTFTIYPIPTLALNDTSAIWREDLNSIDVRYSGTELTGGTYTYTISDNNNVTVISETNDQTFPATNLIPVNTKDLTPGTYSLSVTAKSANGCEVSATTTIVIHSPTSVDIVVPIQLTDSCEGTDTPVEVPLQTTYANHYSYKVVKEGATDPDPVKTGDKDVENKQGEAVKDTIRLDIRNWEDGTYTVTVTAENTVIGAKKDSSVNFTIYPKPEISFKTLSAICANDEASASVEVTYTNSYAEKITYHVDQLKPTPAKKVAETEISATGTITLTGTDTWEAGEYRIYATPTSHYGCENNDTAKVDLVINSQPEVKINNIDDICAGVGTLSVAFNDVTGDAHAYAFRILNDKNKSVKVDTAAISSSPLSIDVQGLAAGSYKFELKTQTEKGCWSEADALPFNVRDTFLFVTRDTICESETYTWKYGNESKDIKVSPHFLDEKEDRDTIVNVEKSTIYGCDSVYRLILRVEKEHVFKTEATICHGEKFNWTVTDMCGNEVELMRGLTDTTHQEMTLNCDKRKCPPVYILDLRVRDEYAAATEYYTLSEGETYAWRGQDITEAGTYEDRVPQETGEASGCDSVWRIIVDKSKVEQKVSNQDVCYGETVYFNKKQFTNLPVGQSVLFDTLRTTNGYDSVYLRLNLTVGQRYYDSVTVSTCDHYVWPVNGNTYLHSGIYREELATVDGCDSIFVLNLTVNKEYEFYETYDITEDQLPYTVHEFTYTASGEYERAFTAQGGCDSIYHLTINVREELYPSDTITREACTNELPYLWREGEFYHTGIYSVTTHTPDSTHVLYLTVNEAYSDTTYVHACSSYTWPVTGDTYTASTIVPVDMKTTLDCDSTVVLKLTIGKPTTAEVGVKACQYEMTTVGNRTFVPTGTIYPDFTRTLRNSSGCDSTITYKVTVIPRIYRADTTFAAICAGDTYPWRDKEYTKAGTYYDSVPGENGCTKEIYTLVLSHKPTYHFDEDIEVSEDAVPYAWTDHKDHTMLADTLLWEDGDYYDNHTSVISDCDSIYHIHFHVTWVTRDTVKREGCESYTWKVADTKNTYTFTESGLYSDTVFNSDHTKYSKVHFCDVTIHHGFSEEEPAFTICRNEAFTWHGQNYAANHFTAGDHPLTTNGKTGYGCDSIYTSTVHVVESYNYEESYAACPTELPYEWHGQLLSTAGTYTDEHFSALGCDSVYTMTFSVKTVKDPRIETATICQGKSYTWANGNNLLIKGNEPGEYSYYHWYTAPGECAQTYNRLDLTVTDPAKPIVTDTTVCFGKSYNWTVPGCDGETLVTLLKGLTETTHQVMTLDCNDPEHPEQCNPVYELNLIACPEYSKDDEPVQICAGGSYLWRNGIILTEAGEHEYIKEGVAENGCDSIFRIKITKLEPKEEDYGAMSVCYGEDVNFSNKTYTDLPIGKQTLKDTILSIDGCDSIYRKLDVTVGGYYDTLTVTACDEYVWQGETYNQSCTDSRKYTTVTGCDSILVLNLTVNKEYEFYETYDITVDQLPYTVHEYTFKEAGTFDDEYNSIGGCDSIYHITVNVHEKVLPKDTITQTICEGTSISWGGQDCTTNGLYSYTEKDGEEKVAIHYLNLIVNEKYSNTSNKHHCGDAYTWEVDGNTYYASGTYTWEGQSLVTGCDSTEILVLTLVPDNSKTVEVTACQGEKIVVGGHAFIAMEDISFSETKTTSDCEYTITYNVTVSVPTDEGVTNASFCEGKTYEWDNTAEGGHVHTYDKAGTYFDTIADANGCAAKIFTLELTANPQYRFDEDVETMIVPIEWRGKKLSESGDYYDSLVSVISGCDSIYHIHFVGNLVERDTVDLVGCESVTWKVKDTDKTYTFTESGLYSDTVFTDAPTNKKYEVIHFCDVTVNHSFEEVESDITICRSEAFSWHGQNYEANHFEPGDHELATDEKSIAGCDSIYKVTIHVGEPFNQEEAVTVCPTELPYLWRGEKLTEGGDYTDVRPTPAGCDSTFVLHLTVNSHVTKPDTLDDIICIGKTYKWKHGDELLMTIKGTELGTKPYYHYYTVPGECAETYHMLNLTVVAPDEPILTDTVICHGATFDWIVPGCDGVTPVMLMKGLTENTEQVMTLDCDTINACNPIYALKLEVLPEYAAEDEPRTLCAGESFPWRGGIVIDKPGTYKYVAEDAAKVDRNGKIYICDSVYRITVDQLEPERKPVLIQTACYGEEVTFNNKTYTNLPIGKHTIKDTIQSIGGCDSVYLKLDLTVGGYYDTLTVTACDEYVWQGETYDQSCTDSRKYTTVTGCDSILVLNLTINKSFEENETYDILDTQLPYTVREHTFKEAGTFDDEYNSIGGCDSIYHITVNVHEKVLPADTITQTICEGTSISWGGQDCTTNGLYSYTEKDGEEKVAIHYLNLIVNEKYSHTSKVPHCGDAYTWEVDGNTYYASGTYTWEGQSLVTGCDSTEILVLTLGQDDSRTEEVTACQYEPIVVGSHSFIAMENISFTETKTNASGCESTITYNVTVTPREYVTPAINDAFCEGSTYEWDNTADDGHVHTYDKAGTYFDTIADAGGCATKIFTLELTAKPQYRIDEDVEVAEQALPYKWLGHKNDTLLSTNGDYYDIYPATEDRCDSVHHIHFHVNFFSRDTVDSIGCGSIEWRGESYTESGLVTDTVYSNDGRNDSIYYCNAIIYQPFEEVEPDITICQSDAFSWHDQDYAANHFEPGDHELATDEKSIAGCDSIYKVTLHVIESFREEQTLEVCPSELPYLWRGQLLNEKGDYTAVRPSPTGCDSTFVLHLTVNTKHTEPSTEPMDVCQDSLNPITWQDLTIPIATPGEYTYYHYYTVPGECDETYLRLDLTVNRSEQVGGYDTAHICYQDSYMWHGEARTVPETDKYLQPDGTYAINIDAYKPNILGCDSLDAHLHLVMHTPTPAITLGDTTICDKYLWIDTLITTTGTYTKAFTTVYGCKDSTLTRHFDVFISSKDTLEHVTHCGDSYRWEGQDFTVEGDTLAEHHEKLDGICDSIVYLPLTLHKPVRDTIDYKACDSFKWSSAKDGETYTKSGIYEGKTEEAANGCDSIPYLRLTINYTKFVDHDTTACDEFVWKGTTYLNDAVINDTTQYGECNCDSITRWHLTIHKSELKYDTLDACRSYTYKGVEYRDTTDLVIDDLKTIYGCDSIVRLHVNVTQPDTIFDTIRTCNLYERDGKIYEYSCDTVQDYACDSVVMLNITIDLDRDSNIWVTRWDSYEWEGKTFTRDTIVTDTLQTIVGCDSIVTLHLIINDSKDTVERAIACESFEWEWDDNKEYTESGEYTVTKRIDEGIEELERDSTRTLILGIGHKKYTAIEETACDFFNWHGVQYFESQTVEYNYTDTCVGNVDTLHLTIYHRAEAQYYDTACDVLTVQGKSYFRDTTFTQQLKTVHGCDSIVNYNLIINRRQTRNISVTACDNYTWEGDTYTKSGVYTKVLTGTNGCDSVVTLNLSVRPSYHHEFDVVSCDGYYVWGTRIIDVAGDYDSIFTFDDRCDSVVTMHLSLPEKIQGPWVMDTACDEYWWNGQRYTETGYYYETFTSSTGCDSIARLDLTIAPNPRDTITEKAQTRFTWGNETYYETGLYEQRFRSETGYGCDSIVTLDLTITNPLPINQIADTACDAYTWDAETFYESGIYTRNFTTPEGNDSIVKLSLVINHDVAVSDSMQLCDSIEWNGVMYYESGVYTQVLQTVTGCDSVVTMTLTVCQRDSSTFTATARDVYTWDGVDYTESGTYTRGYTSSTGCDSTVTMILTIIHNVHVDLSDTACTEYAWADSIYTHSTIHTEVFTGDNGSDSVVTMTIIIHEPVYTDQFDTVRVCDPEDPSYAEYYTLPWGEQVSHTGIYNDTLTSELSQCDSIVRFHLQWCDEKLCLDTTTFVVNDQCESYEWEGQTYTTSGTYTRHHRLENGCDSIVIMRLDIKPKAQTVVDLTACDSLFWEDADRWIYETGFYYDTLQAGNGCDSLVIMHAVVGHKGDSILDVETCDAFTINGKTYRETGTYIQELKTTTGCDSTLTINLIVNPSVDTVVADTACDSHLWNDVTLTETGFYPMVLQSEITGCDSVVDLHLIVYGSKEVSVIDSLHCDSIVWGDAYSGIDTIHDDGIYVKTFHSTVGCDSTVTMDLRLLRHDLVLAPDTAACDSFVWNGKVYFESGTYSDTLTNSFTGCDSITTRFVEINPTLHVEIEDSVPPPFYLWPTENDTIWESGVYVDTTASLVTGCDSITTLYLIMTDSIILDPQEPVRVDTFGYCLGDTMDFVYNLLKGHPTKYILLFPDMSVVQEIDPTRDFIQVTDTTELPNHGLDSLFTLVIPENCQPKVYHAQLQLFDDYSCSEVYDFYIRVNYRGAIVSMWTDVVAINNYTEEFIGYQWYKDGVEIEGATKQYYSDGEDLYACYRAKLQLAADSSWIYTCEECFDLRTDSLELIAYPTPAPVGQPVTIKAMGIILEKLVGSTLTITKESGLKVDEFTLAEGQRSVDVNLTSGMYIATLVTGDADDRVRTANVKFIVF